MAPEKLDALEVEILVEPLRRTGRRQQFAGAFNARFEKNLDRCYKTFLLLRPLTAGTSKLERFVASKLYSGCEVGACKSGATHSVITPNIRI